MCFLNDFQSLLIKSTVLYARLYCICIMYVAHVCFFVALPSVQTALLFGKLILAASTPRVLALARPHADQFKSAVCL